MENIYTQRINELRGLMAKEGIGVYFVPMDDCHSSEYVAAHFNCISFLSGFTGSAGQIVVTQENAWIYVDGRYFIQGAKQIEGTCLTLMKWGYKGVPLPADLIADEMAKALQKDGALAFGFDGAVVNSAMAGRFIEKIEKKCGTVTVKCDKDLVDQVWTDRPEQEFTPVWAYDEKYTGESCTSKLARTRAKLAEEADGADYRHIINSLDDIAWIFNIRANDVPCNPVVFAYAEITKDKAVLYAGKDAVSADVAAYLKDQGVELGVYTKTCLNTDDGTRSVILQDEGCMSYNITSFFKNAGFTIKNISNPSTAMKGVKNETEQSHARDALLRDSAVLCRFMKWLKDRSAEALASGKAEDGGAPFLKYTDGNNLNELTADEYLTALRKEDPDYIELSFDTIAGYSTNGAIVHYEAKPDNFSEIRADNMLLVDSGCQYMDGTTDITRTFVLGPVTDEFKQAFTLVAAAMLRLLNVKFQKGCSGENLDIIARQPLWNYGMDYNHGTGHGVGHMLNVHEGPHNISYHLRDKHTAYFEEGMIVTDEPGIYREGKFGVRTENELLCRHWKDTDEGEFLCFENLTWIPVDLDGIDKKYLTEEDIKNLNEYHRNVYEKVSPLLDEETAQWLKEYTRQI